MRVMRILCIALGLSWLSLSGVRADTEDDSEALARQLSNPVASLISVPLQLNYDEGFGPEDEGDRIQLNIQPVIPFSISENWNLISRTILPVIDQQDLFPGAGSQTGVGDVVQSLFFSPKAPTSGGLIWGVGPVFLLPTGGEELITADQWGLGPTFVVLKQSGPRTIGALANHIESVSNSSDGPDVRATFVQPFFSRTTPTAVTFAANLETTYDWESEAWSVPLNFTVTKVQRWGSQLVSVGGGVRYWLDAPDSGPEGFGARLLLTFLFPR